MIYISIHKQDYPEIYNHLMSKTEIDFTDKPDGEDGYFYVEHNYLKYERNNYSLPENLRHQSLIPLPMGIDFYCNGLEATLSVPGLFTIQFSPTAKTINLL